ncbi:NAD+ kinase [Ruaniaceae bacterium KH17]|nr:NAD+ kinase [Ruaniaceae bacterium KH17]
MNQAIAIVRHDRADVDVQVEVAAHAIEEAGGTVLDEEHAAQADVVLVLGGDGTMLRATEVVRGANIPVIGVNLGHVGFLAEAEPSDDLATIASRLVTGDYTVERRMAIEVTVIAPDDSVETSWALNECAILKLDRARMIDVNFAVDGHAVSSFGCDTLVFATPTGSTAYAFSGGGPIVWPDVEALLAVPIAAHALFARPMVVGPDSVMAAELTDGAELSLDGRRTIIAPAGSVVTVERSPQPVLLARLTDTPFSARLVAKFNLPVEGWRRR